MGISIKIKQVKLKLYFTYSYFLVQCELLFLRENEQNIRNLQVLLS